MKRMLLLVWGCIASIYLFAQGEIQFSLLKTSQKDIPQTISESLDLKLKQILTRNSAAAAGTYNVFAIEPVLELTDAMSSEGLMQNVSIVQGELTLIAKNLVDDAMYYSVVVPLNGHAVGDGDKAMKALVNSIKVTNVAFTRFIRIARQKIQDYYASNCGVILQKAQTLYEQRKYPEAVSYLSAVSEILPCYEQASVLLAELAKHTPVGADTVVVERIVEQPVEIEKVVEKPVPTEKTPALDCQVSISVNDLDVKVLKCYGNETQRRITIELEVLNRNADITSSFVYFHSAYTPDGLECKKRGALRDRANVSYGVKFPSQVKLRQNYYVLEIPEKIQRFSYIELEIRGAKVIVRNLPVEWQ